MGREVDWREILTILPHRYPFLMVDRIVELDLENLTATGIKNVTFNEPYFVGHFPSEPIMPGVMILEAMAQVGGVLAALATPEYKKGDPIYFLSIDKVRFRRPVRPGDVLTTKVETLRPGSRIWKMAAKAYVGDELAAEAQLMASLSAAK